LLTSEDYNAGIQITLEVVNLSNDGQITLEDLEMTGMTTQGKSTMAVILPGVTACGDSDNILALTRALLFHGFKVCLYSVIKIQ